MTKEIDLDALRAAAEAATPGPWEMQQDAFDNEGVPESPVTAMDGKAFVAVTLDFGPNNPLMREANALYIAAFNPQTARALLDRLRKAEAANKWMPIETAPKDGTHVQLYAPELQFVGFYAVAGWCYVAPRCPEAPTQPTHWKPLGAAPTSADSEGEKG